MSKRKDRSKETSLHNEQTVEEVRVIISGSQRLTDVVQALNEQGIAAVGDYRDDAERALLLDALLDGIEYVVYQPLVEHFAVRNVFAESILDYQVRVYITQEDIMKAMPVGALIKLIHERRHIRKH